MAILWQPNHINSMGLPCGKTYYWSCSASLRDCTHWNFNGGCHRQEAIQALFRGETILVPKHDLHCLGFYKRVLVDGVCGINSVPNACCRIEKSHTCKQNFGLKGPKAIVRRLWHLWIDPAASIAPMPTQERLASGQTIQDYHAFVKRKMYVLCYWGKQ